LFQHGVEPCRSDPSAGGEIRGTRSGPVTAKGLEALAGGDEQATELEERQARGRAPDTGDAGPQQTPPLGCRQTVGTHEGNKDLVLHR
jgi:hypothetical protein